MAPLLFLQGSKDPFADPAVVTRALAMLPGATRQRREGGDHSHKVVKRSVEDVTAELADATAQWLKAR